MLIPQQVKSEIYKKLSTSRQLLKSLGTKRETADEQRQYLLSVSEQFQKIVTSALSADYVSDDCFDKSPTIRFATEVVNRNEVLGKMLEQHGHSYTFDDAQPASSSSTEGPEDGYENEEKIRVRFQDDPDDLEALPFGEDTIVSQPSEDILMWLSKVYETSR